MDTVQLTHTQLYTGFIGLKPNQIISRHPLGIHLKFNGEYNLSYGMTSLEYHVDSSLAFVFIMENGRVSVQKTYCKDAEIMYELLFEKSDGVRDYNGEFLLDIPQGRVRVALSYEGTNTICLIAGDF